MEIDPRLKQERTRVGVTGMGRPQRIDTCISREDYRL